MCGTCGCSADVVIRFSGADGRVHQGHDDDHIHADDHEHDGRPDGHGDADARTVLLQQKVLAKNDELAAGNRAWLARRGVVAVNLMSSPGSGKTTLLERTAADLGGDLALSVVEGDQETTLDADRIEAAGCPVVQVNTGAGCHLDAAMVASALRALDPPARSVVLIENVGNLVCPALFDLGEAGRVVLAAVTEGADKPVKYPQMFRGADLVLVTKIDLLPHVDFDLDRCAADLAKLSPNASVLPLSARTGDGLSEWYAWLRHAAGAVGYR